jgi:hypothetical protein
MAIAFWRLSGVFMNRLAYCELNPQTEWGDKNKAHLRGLIILKSSWCNTRSTGAIGRLCFCSLRLQSADIILSCLKKADDFPYMIEELTIS